MTRRLVAPVGVAIAVELAVVIVLAAPAGALFDHPGLELGATFEAATLEPPDDAQVAWRCQGADAIGSVTWAPTVSTFATGYRVYVGGTLAGETSSTSYTLTARRNDQLEIDVEAVAHSWTSARHTLTTKAACSAARVP